MFTRPGHQSVFAILSGSRLSGEAVDRLRRAGFAGEDISVLMPARSDDRNVAYRKSTKASEGIAAGATGGAALGAGLGWLAGMGALGVPGIGPFIAAGPLLALLAGAGIGGTAGGIAGALVGLGVPEYEARRYEGFAKEGHVLLSVHAESGLWIERAKRILKECGGRDISVSDEVRAPTTVTGKVRPLTRADDYQFHK